MESRITRLEELFARIEAKLDSIDNRLRCVGSDVAEMKGRLYNLPGTWAVMSIAFCGPVALGGVLFATMKLASAH